MYDVRLGKIDLYGVLSVEVSKGRDITVYDSIGGGKFPKAKSRNLNVYNIELELSEFKQYKYKSDFTQAKKIFREFDKLLNKQSPVRLIVYNERRKISQLVLLEKYDTREKYSGVYEVNIKCTEYVEANIRTTNIPQIVRQGKIPNPPPRAIIKNPVEFAKKVAGASTMGPMDDFLKFNEWHTRDSWGNLNYTDPKTGKTFLGLANIPRNKPVNPIWVATHDEHGNVNGKEALKASKINKDSPLVKGAKKAFDGISNFWKGYFDIDKQNDSKKFGD